MKYSLLSLVAAAAVFAPAVARAQLTPVFEYRFPASYDGTEPEGAVADQSAAGHDAKAYGRFDDVVLLSDDVPAGAPAGAKSLDFVAANGSVRTDEPGLLSRDSVIDAGGFTMEVWFKGVPDSSVTTTPKIFDSWGTDFIAVTGGNADGDDNQGEVVVRLSEVANTWRLDADDGLIVDGWNHILFTFTVTDGSDPNGIVGDVSVILNDVVRTFGNRVMTGRAVNADRPVSIGRHPTNNSEFYEGLVYNPALYFGVEPLAQAVVALVESSADGFTATIRDGASPVLPASVTATLDGETVAVTATKDGDVTTVTYAPPQPLTGGVRSIGLQFADQAGGTGNGTFEVLVIGQAVTPVFAYRFPESWDGTDPGQEVVDLSGSGENAAVNTVSGEALPLSEDVPAGAPAGARSLDFTAEQGSVSTVSTRLLNREGVVTAGGFTGELWFKGVPDESVTALQKIMDYAGTEFIAVSGADTDNDGSPGELAVRYSTVVRRLDVDDGLLIDGWNHVIASFTVTAAADLGSMTGTVEINLNGKVTRFANQTLNNQGDSLDRVTAIGAHPSTGGEQFTGLVYNPSLQFGVVPADPPVVTARASAAAGLEVTLEDSASVEVDPDSVQVLVDGQAVTASAFKEGGLSTVMHSPATPLTAGRHSVVVRWVDGQGAPGEAVRSIVIVGSQYAPLLQYRFPDSYDGTEDQGTVFDLSGLENNAVATGATAGTPVPLSDDVPPDAPAGARSLDFSAARGIVATQKLQILNNPQIVEHGGFTVDLWFRGGLDETLTKVLDYAGTEYVGVRSGDSDGDGNEGEVVVSISNNVGFAVLDSDEGFVADGWNHLIVAFQVTDEFEQTSILGDVTITLNGTETIVNGAALTALGDSLNRPLAIGRHPVNDGEHFTGLVYNPSVFLGVAPDTGGPDDPVIAIARDGDNLVITFTGTLQSSDNLATFEDVPAAVSPWTVPAPLANRKFFRAR